MSIRRSVTLLLALCLALAAIAATPADSGHSVESSATFVVTTDGAPPTVVVDVGVTGKGEEPRWMTRTTYRQSDGGIVELGTSFSHADQPGVHRTIDGVADTTGTYVVRLAGSGVVRFDGATGVVEVDGSALPVRINGSYDPWTAPRLNDGGYRYEMSPPALPDVPLVSMLTYTTVREEIVGFNHTDGFICIEGPGTACDDTEERLDETNVYPLGPRATLASTWADLPAGSDPVVGVVDVYRPGGQAVDDWSLMLTVPRSIPAGWTGS